MKNTKNGYTVLAHCYNYCLNKFVQVYYRCASISYVEVKYDMERNSNRERNSEAKMGRNEAGLMESAARRTVIRLS